MASDKDGKAVTKCGIKAEVADSDSNSSDDSSSFSGSKDGSHVATPQRGRSSEQLRGERGTQETDSEDEDGSSSRATDDSEDAEGAGAAEDAAERVVDNKEDGEDAEADAGDSEDSEDSSGSDDDRVLVERGGKFSFLSVKDLNSQEKKLYGLIPSGSSPALASTPKLQPATGQSGKRQARLPLLGTKRDGVPVGTSGATRSRARFRTTMSDTTVTQAKGEMTSKVGGSISTTTASSTTLRAAQRRRSEKTPSCPTMSLTDRRKAGLVWKPAGPSKAPPTDVRTKSQELKARCSRSASGDVPPGVDPATLYRSPYAFSPERRRELSRRLRDRLDDEKKAEDAKRLEEESRKKEAEQAFNVWVESKRQQSLHQDDLELNPRLSKKLIDATQREAAESAFNDWLQMKRRQRMDEMRRREEERQKYMMALENTMEYRRKAEKAYKRWFKKKQKPALLKRKRIGVGASATAGSFTSGRHHVTAKGQRMLAGATMRREPAQRPPRSLVRKTSSSVNQLPAEPLSLATAANYFRLLYCM